MSHKKVNYLPLILLPVIIILCFALWTSNKTPVLWAEVDSDTGVFDLRDFDFPSAIAAPSRTVEYVIGELLTPGEFALREDIQTGRVPDNTKVVTMRARYLVPDDIIYGIGGYSVNYASTVYVNGKWMFEEGKPALALEDEESSEAYRLFAAQPVDGIIEIVIATSGFSSVDTAFGMNWHIGEYESIRINHSRMIAVNTIVMTCYIVLAFISLLLFLVLPSYKANGWLSLLALVWVVRVGLKSEKILLTLFPDHTWNFVFKTEVITSPLTILLLALVLRSVFTGALSKWVCTIIAGCAGLAAAVMTFLPWPTFLGHSVWSNPYIYWSIAVMLLFILISMRRTKPTLAQIIILVGMGLVVFAFAWDEDYFRHVDGFAITQPMMLVFIGFMLVATLLDTMQKTAAQEVQLTQTVESQKRELTEARISVMLSQIQPHFLYNSLSSIALLCKEKPENAFDSIMDFSNYLRGNLDALSISGLISFKSELAHIETYTKLEKMRFKNKLDVVFNIETDGFNLPVLTVQPIVENAIKHGLGKKKDGGTVTISSCETDAEYIVAVTDNGVGFDVNEEKNDGKTHVGIENVRNRLWAKCNGTLDIQSETGSGTTAVIKIPKTIGGTEHENTGD